jgi:hypothetical protein
MTPLTWVGSKNSFNVIKSGSVWTLRIDGPVGDTFSAEASDFDGEVEQPTVPMIPEKPIETVTRAAIDMRSFASRLIFFSMVLSSKIFLRIVQYLCLDRGGMLIAILEFREKVSVARYFIFFRALLERRVYRSSFAFQVLEPDDS